MSFKSATGNVELKNFIKVLNEIPAPKKISPSSVNLAFSEYFDYLFSVAQRLHSFFQDKSFAKTLVDAGVDKYTVENLEFWSTMVGKTPDTAATQIYFGDKPLSYLRELISTRNPKAAIEYVETVFNIKSKTQNPAELAASICDSMAMNIFNRSKEAHKVLTEKVQGQEATKPSFFGSLFKGHGK